MCARAAAAFTVQPSILIWIPSLLRPTTHSSMPTMPKATPRKTSYALFVLCDQPMRARISTGVVAHGIRQSQNCELKITTSLAGLFSNNVIEHFTTPVEEFRYFHSILAPGALMAHATPCYHYVFAFTRFHVIFLTGDAAEILAERSGFRVLARDEDGDYRNCVFQRL